HVETGALDLACGGTNSSTFIVDAGTTVNFGLGSYNLAATSSVSGDGTVSVAPGGATTTAGGVNWAGGTLNVLGYYNVSNTVIPSGTINFASDAATTTLNLRSDYNDGTLTGIGNLTVTAAATWSGGVMTGKGQTDFEGRLLLGGGD